MDISSEVETEKQVVQLQSQQSALLREILPQQVSLQGVWLGIPWYWFNLIPGSTWRMVARMCVSFSVRWRGPGGASVPVCIGVSPLTDLLTPRPTDQQTNQPTAC